MTIQSLLLFSLLLRIHLHLLHHVLCLSLLVLPPDLFVLLSLLFLFVLLLALSVSLCLLLLLSGPESVHLLGLPLFPFLPQLPGFILDHLNLVFVLPIPLLLLFECGVIDDLKLLLVLFLLVVSLPERRDTLL